MDYKSLPMPKTRLTGKKCKFIIDEVTTPIRSKPKNRKASVEVIADTEIPIGWTSPSASTKKKTHTLRTLVCDLHLVEFNASTPFEREKIDVDQLVWSEYHAALFDQVMVLFKGGSCAFEKRVQFGDMVKLKRVKFGGAVGIICTLKCSTLLFKFENREMRNKWYNQLVKLRRTSMSGASPKPRIPKRRTERGLSVSFSGGSSSRRSSKPSSSGSRSSRRSSRGSKYVESTYERAYTDFEEDFDDVFEDASNDDTATNNQLNGAACSDISARRSRIQSCPNSNELDRSRMSTPGFRSLRFKKKSIESQNPKRKNFFKTVLKKFKLSK